MSAKRETATRSGRGASAADDPLDAAGRGPNMLTGAPTYTAAREAWAAKWSKFPVYAMKDKLREMVASIERNQVTVVVSGTGSGKTVLAVPLVLRHVLRAGGASRKSSASLGAGMVAVTLPKRAPVVAAAGTGAMTLDVALGREVGYQHRGSPPEAFSRGVTRLVYATDGTLLAQARKDPMLREYAAVVVDEAHERPVPTDLLLLALRGVLAARPEFRLLVMSATIDPALFRDYFSKGAADADGASDSKGGRGSRLTVGVVEVAGAPMHPIERRFDPPPRQSPQKQATETSPETVHDVHDPAPPPVIPKDYLARGLAAACQVLTDPQQKARASKASKAPKAAKAAGVILFVPTTRDAATGCRAFEKACQAAKGASSCASLYGKMSKEAQADALAPPQEAEGKVAKRGRLFVATNVAESSLTIDGITHVVDTGLQLSSAWDPRAHGTRLSKGMASQAQITQRIGRAGRTGPGAAVLLYTEAQLAAQPAFPPPAILGVDLEEHTLASLAGGRRPVESRTSGRRSEADSSKTTQTALKTQTALEGVHSQFAELLTPPTRAQVVCATAALHFYGLLSVVDAAGKPVRYEDVGYASLATTPRKSRSAVKKVAATKTKGGGASKANENAKAAAETKVDVPPPLYPVLRGDVTPLGRQVQRTAEAAKLGVHNALLAVMGAVHGCAAEAADLAMLLEGCAGELSTLWKEDAVRGAKGNPGGDDMSRLLATLLPAGVPPEAATSDHVALLAILRGAAMPAMQNSGKKSRSQEVAVGGGDGRRPEGVSHPVWRLLAPGPWHAAAERVRRDGGRTATALAARREEIEAAVRAHAPHLLPRPAAPAARAPPAKVAGGASAAKGGLGANSFPLRRLVGAVVAARMYLLAAPPPPPPPEKKKQPSPAAAADASPPRHPHRHGAPGKHGGGDAPKPGSPAPAQAHAHAHVLHAPSNANRLRTMLPVQPVDCAVDPLFAHAPSRSPGALFAVVEQLVETGGQWHASGVTWLPAP